MKLLCLLGFLKLVSRETFLNTRLEVRNTDFLICSSNLVLRTKNHLPMCINKTDMSAGETPLILEA